MNPRIILEALVGRLEPIVGDMGPGDFSAWEGEEEALSRRTAAGEGHLAKALLTARKALASGDDAMMSVAALICPALERTGRQIAGATPRRRGGRSRAAQINDRWEPYVAQYRALLSEGKSPAVASATVKRRMEAAGWSVADRTIRDHLK